MDLLCIFIILVLIANVIVILYQQTHIFYLRQILMDITEQLDPDKLKQRGNILSASYKRNEETGKWEVVNDKMR